MIYQLWDVETGNLVEDFLSEAEALNAARELIALSGESYAEILALASADEAGGGVLIAEGPSLLERAVSFGTSPASRSA